MVVAEQNLRELLEKIAKEQNYENYQAEIEAVSSGGANYSSELFKVTLSAPGKPDLKLFAKAGALSEKIRTLASISIFDVEILFYTKILHKYKALEDRNNVPKEHRLAHPKFYGGCTESKKDLLVLEDLTHIGYRPFNRFKCFDWAYTSKCLSMVAKLHALSVAYERDDPVDYVKTAEIIKYKFPVEDLRNILVKNFETVIENTDKTNRERVKQFLESQLKDQSFFKFYRPEKTIFFIHGDFRPSNILQKTDEDGKLKAMILDHQIYQRGRPMTDILFFLITNSDEEFRGKHLHQYFEYYYEELRTALQRFGIDSEDVYKKEEYDEDVKETLPFGLTLGACVLPVITVDESKAVKPEGFEMENLVMEVSEEFGIRFNGLVRDYVKLGIL